MLPRPPVLENSVEECGNQTGIAIKQLATDRVKAGHRAQSPPERDYMKRFPIELARYFEYCGVRPEEKWRLALYRVNVGSTSVHDLVCHDGIHRFTVNWTRDGSRMAIVRKIVPSAARQNRRDL